MAIKFVEDFGSDSLANIENGGRWDFNGGGTGMSLNTTAGPYGEGAFLVSGANNQSNFLHRATFAVNPTTTCYLCGHLKINSYPAAGLSDIFHLWDGTTVQASLGLTTTGMNVYRNTANGGTALGTLYTGLVLGQWVWVVAKIVVGTGTSGSIEVRINNTAVIGPTSSLNTAQSGVAQVNGVGVGSSSAGSGSAGTSSFLSNFILLDSSGSVNNNFLTSPTRVYVRFPTANGTYAQFTPSSGSNWQRVSNNPSTGNSSYNAANVAVAKDTFNHAAIPSNVISINGVQTQFIAVVDDAHTITTQAVLYDGTTEVDPPTTAIGLSPSNQWVEGIQETNLTSGLAFTASDINNLQFGYRLTTS